MFFAATSIALLCLVSVSHSAPPACEDSVRPVDQLDPHHLEGRWAFVAASMKDKTAADHVKKRDSVVVYLRNSSYTQVDNAGDTCQYHHRNLSLEGHSFNFPDPFISYNGTFYQTSCPDCVLVSLDIESPKYNTTDFYLLSRRREVDQTVMEEFKARMECLKMPPPFMMDPTKELCAEQPASKPEAQIEEEAEGQKA